MNAEKENTWRALQDQELLITSFLCRWGWHRWTRWSDPYIPKNGKYNLQHATCVHCDKMRIRRLKDQDNQSL